MAEKYSGTKFETIFLGKKFFAEKKSEELIYWGKIFRKNGLAPSYGKGSSGNLSFRSKNGFVITPTASFFSKLLPKDLVEVVGFDLKKNIAFACGKKIPSSETPMHFLLYKNFPKINAVFHFHDNELLEKAEFLKIPCTEKAIAYGSIASAKAVAKVLKKSSFCCIKEHGFVAIGKTLNEAGKLSLKLHKLL